MTTSKAVESSGAPAGTPDFRRHWKERRARQAFVALEDGTILRGHSIGAPVDALGEVVFNTGMTGYQEILSDPSYHGQLVTMTYPEIGNTGANAFDMESRRGFANGLIVRESNPASNWRADEPLDAFLLRHGIPAIAGVDTRALTSNLRDSGTLKGYLAVSGDVTENDAVEKARAMGRIGRPGLRLARHVRQGL